jgi:hypothetical protein
MIIGTATNGGWFSGLSKKVSQYIKVEPIDITPVRIGINNKYNFLNLDYKQMGVGCDVGWPKRPHPQYRLPAKPYGYSFRLQPYTPAMGKIKNVARRKLPIIQ